MSSSDLASQPPNEHGLAQNEPAQSPSPSYPPGSPPPAASSDKAPILRALSFVGRAAPPPADPEPLPRPIAIPQARHGRGRPFIRAYPPSLQAHAITQPDFLAFLDNLNVVSTANPPLRALDAAGDLLTNVPYHWSVLVGIGIQVVAQLGTVAVSWSRTKAYVKAVNEQLFAPRGLQVYIASTKHMKAVLGMPEAHPVMAPLTPETMKKTALERQLLGIGPHNADLDLDVPPPEKQKTFLGRWSANQVARQMKKSHKKAVKKREKAAEKAKKRAKKEGENKKKGRNGDGSGGIQTGSPPDQESQGKKIKESREEKKGRKVSWIIIKNL